MNKRLLLGMSRKKMKNVLIIAHEFPPFAGSGVQRTLKFIKYLPLFGWNPIVLTVNSDGKMLKYQDTDFINENLTNIKIYKTKVLELYNLYRSFGGRKKQGSDIFGLKERSSTTGKLQHAFNTILIPDKKIGWYPFARLTFPPPRQIIIPHAR